MTVHSIHIFDRKGATLFTKTYSRSAKRQGLQLQETTGSTDPDTNPMDEQRKLVFGMLFSLKSSILKNLTPSGKDAGENRETEGQRKDVLSFVFMTSLFFLNESDLNLLSHDLFVVS